jgi:hypothetical protein
MNSDSYDPAQAAGLEALEILRLMILDDSITAPARVSAAKALLDRFAPKDDLELKRREAEERASAIAEARCLLAELAAAEPLGTGEPIALAENRTTGADHATGNAEE